MQNRAREGLGTDEIFLQCTRRDALVGMKSSTLLSCFCMLRRYAHSQHTSYNTIVAPFCTRTFMTCPSASISFTAYSLVRITVYGVANLIRHAENQDDVDLHQCSRALVSYSAYPAVKFLRCTLKTPTSGVSQQTFSTAAVSPRLSVSSTPLPTRLFWKLIWPPGQSTRISCGVITLSSSEIFRVGSPGGYKDWSTKRMGQSFENELTRSDSCTLLSHTTDTQIAPLRRPAFFSLSTISISRSIDSISRLFSSCRCSSSCGKRFYMSIMRTFRLPVRRHIYQRYDYYLRNLLPTGPRSVAALMVPPPAASSTSPQAPRFHTRGAAAGLKNRGVTVMRTKGKQITRCWCDNFAHAWQLMRQSTHLTVFLRLVPLSLSNASYGQDA